MSIQSTARIVSSRQGRKSQTHIGRGRRVEDASSRPLRIEQLEVRAAPSSLLGAGPLSLGWLAELLDRPAPTHESSAIDSQAGTGLRRGNPRREFPSFAVNAAPQLRFTATAGALADGVEGAATSRAARLHAHGVGSPLLTADSADAFFTSLAARSLSALRGLGDADPNVPFARPRFTLGVPGEQDRATASGSGSGVVPSSSSPGGGGGGSTAGPTVSAGDGSAASPGFFVPPQSAFTSSTIAAPSSSSTATSASVADSTAPAWTIPTNIGQCAPPAGNPAATFDNAAAAGLLLVDAAGQPLNISLNENTLVIGAATWCGNTAKLKAQLSTPEAQAALDGMRIVWAFGDEGGAGPAGVLHSEFLEGLPGETAFLAENSVRPWRFPSAFNADSGQFDLHPLDVIESWIARGTGAVAGAANGVAAAPLVLVDAGGQSLSVPLNANTIVIAAATWCPHCAEFKAMIGAAQARGELAGLQLVFAFTNEGGAGVGGVQHPEFLADVPGEVVFLAPSSVQPGAFPMAYNAASGEFDVAALDAVRAWVEGGSGLEPAGNGPPAQGMGMLAGDFTMDAAVNGGDFLMWQRDFGLAGPGLASDGTGDEIVDGADLALWQMHYGEVLVLPGAFAITGPLGVQTQKANTITWDAAAGATSYHFKLSQQPDVSFPLYDEVVAGTSKSLTLQNGTYYVGVTAINAAGETLATNYGFQLQVDLPPADQLIFVTATKYFISNTPAYPPVSITFNGVAAADYICTSIANGAGLLAAPWDGQTIHFKAMLTLTTLSLEDRATMQNGAYYNTTGQIVAASKPDLFAGTLAAPIKTQNDQALPGNQLVFTGANADGSAASSKCGNWTTTSGSVNVGNVNGTGTNWLFQQSASCAASARLYCVGDVQANAYHTVTFDDDPNLHPGDTVPVNYYYGLVFSNNWSVADDTLAGQLQPSGNYVNFTQSVSTLAWGSELRFQVPTLQAGPAGLAGFTVRAKNASGTVLDTVTVAPVDPGQSRVQATYHLGQVGGVTTYEFERIENPNAPGAPAPLDNLRIVNP